jgi:cell division protein FtsW
MKLKYSILLPTLALSLFGIIIIYSASSYSAAINHGDAYFYVKKQALAFFAGCAMLFFGTKINLNYLKKYKYYILLASILLLLLVYIPFLGRESYGARRWIDLGFISFQPSEFSKFGLMIFLAGYMDEHPPVNLKSLIVPLLSTILVALAVFLEPNMSITICIVLSAIAIMFIGGLNNKYFSAIAAAICVGLPVLIIAEPYRIRRLLAFADPWATPKDEGYQLIQSYYALGAGRLFGVGLFNSRQKYLFLPFAESDFIFAVIGEELGLFGALSIMAVFGTLIFGGIITALRGKDRYHTLLAAGITIVIAIQTVLNLAVVTGSVPPTGVPLPYVSAGGSSLMIFMFMSGVICNLAGKVTKKMPLP